MNYYSGKITKKEWMRHYQTRKKIEKIFHATPPHKLNNILKEYFLILKEERMCGNVYMLWKMWISFFRGVVAVCKIVF